MRQQANHPYRRKQDLDINYYVEGNTVRRLEARPKEEPARPPMTKEQERHRRQSRQVARRNRERAMHISFGYVLFCAAAAYLLVGVCVAYIKLQSDIISRTKAISRLESQVAALRADNDEEEKRKDLSLDLNKIREQALGYGMQYALPEQTGEYPAERSDYLEQYSDIPEE